jgi:hypothetical protein
VLGPLPTIARDFAAGWTARRWAIVRSAGGLGAWFGAWLGEEQVGLADVDGEVG